MSQDATNWAIQQKGKGFSPGAKLVLWHPADHYNPSFGCFPSQQRIADDCEMSRSTVNEHLKRLEDEGLIGREKRLDEKTNRQKSTRYILGFEDGFGPAVRAEKPCPDFGH